MSGSAAHPPDRLYGRRKGRPLRPRQAALLDSQLEKWGFTPPADRFDPATLFDSPPAALWLEIGFGNGEHLLWQAAANPDTGILGCEPFINGLAQCCARMAEDGVENVRLYNGDARRVAAALAPSTLDRAFILFPDPWPKTRHHKRRIVERETLGHLARALKPGCELRLATDDPDYAEWMLFETMMAGKFFWPVEGPEDWRRRPADWPQTRYEAKARQAGRAAYYLRFMKQSRTCGEKT